MGKKSLKGLKPVHDGVESCKLPVRILRLDGWVILWDLRPHVACFPGEDRPIQVEFVGRVGEVRRRKNFKNMGHLKLLF